jgi:hypothetical protein
VLTFVVENRGYSGSITKPVVVILENPDSIKDTVNEDPSIALYNYMLSAPLQMPVYIETIF